jgi:2-haloacid dehalogenase
MKAIVFDAYGTLFDVFSVTSLCEHLFPGYGKRLAEMWRTKQLEYSWLRSLMGRYRDFWALTEDALVYSADRLKLDLTTARRNQLMESYLDLAAFPDVQPGLEELKRIGMRLAILSNGEPKMLKAAVQSAGIDELIDAVLSVDTVKIFKPAPRVYNQLLDALKVDKAEIGFVSSNNWDVNGAGSAGLTTFWIPRSSLDVPDELGYPPTHIVTAITDLRPLISK